MTLELIINSTEAAGSQGADNIVKIHDFLLARGIEKVAKPDQNKWIETSAQDPSFYSDMLHAIGLDHATPEKPQEFKIDSKADTAIAEIIWRKPHNPESEKVELRFESGSWFVHETASHY